MDKLNVAAFVLDAVVSDQWIGNSEFQSTSQFLSNSL
jgi:hypothetical protein